MTEHKTDETLQTFGDILKKPRTGRLYALVILLGIPATLIGGDMLWREVSYRWFASTVQGRVLDKSETTARKGQQIYRLDYSYSAPDGQNVKKQAVVVKPNWDRFKKGDAVDVRVTTGEGGARLAFEGTHHLVTGCIFLVLGLYVFVLAFLRLNIEERHHKNGQFLARITDARRRTHLLLWITMLLFIVAQLF